MKSVIYHAECRIAKKFKEGTYEKLIKGLKQNLNSFGIPLIHITLEGFEGLGDINYFFPGDPEEVNYNREVLFVEFLKNYAEDDEVYWFTEPDARLVNMFPELEGDVSFTVKMNEERITPQWRLAKKTALPIFEEALSLYGEDKQFWGGDTAVWGKMWHLMGKPGHEDVINYKGITVQMRRYKFYNTPNSYFSRQYKASHKQQILKMELNDDSR